MWSRLELCEIAKVYPGVVALDAVSLTIECGEIVGLVGHNGAGKSTLTRILAGDEQPSRGTLRLDSVPVRFGSPEDALQQRVVLVPQALQIAPTLTVRENLVLGLHGRERRLLAKSSADGPSPLRQITADLGLTSVMGTPAGALRPAGQRLLMIARALLRRPRIIILDEPTAAFAKADVERLLRILRSLRDQGIGILYISHRLDEVLGVVHRVVVMRHGRIIGATPAEDTTKGELAQLIAGNADAIGSRNTTPVPPIRGDAGRRPLLSVAGIARHPRLKPTSLVVHSGEILGLTGLVGSGRTSLLRAICGADAPTAGTVEIDGRRRRFRTPSDAIRSGLAYLPEDRAHNALIADMNVIENVTLSSMGQFTLRGLPLLSLRREREAAVKILKTLDLQPPGAERRKVNTLSGGNQQKVVIARWLMRGVKIFAVDEPTEGIDVGACEEVYALLRELAGQGAAIILSSSDISEVVALSDRVLVMRNGSVAHELAGDDITEATVSRACLLDAA